MPISINSKARRGVVDPKLLEKAAVSAKDRELAELYWELQRKVHTDPKMRAYLHALTRIMRTRKIKPATLNDIGLELVIQNRI